MPRIRLPHLMACVLALLVATLVAPDGHTQEPPRPDATDPDADADAEADDADADADADSNDKPEPGLVQDNRAFRQAVAEAYRLLDDEQWERAELAFIELTRKYPQQGEAFYHLACCYSRWSKSLEGAARDEKLELAIRHLWGAARAATPYDDLRNMARDPDMDPLRDTEDYPKVVAAIRRRLVGPQNVRDARPLHYETFVPRNVQDQVPMLLWCHETGSSAAKGLEQLRAFCAARRWVLVAVQAPDELSSSGTSEKHYGWKPFSELRILRTLRNVLRTRDVGLKIKAARIALGGYRQGAHYALSAALVEPGLTHTVLLVDSPADAATYPEDRIEAVAGKIRIFALHTKHDTLGLDGAREAFQQFAEAGVTVRFEETAAGPDLMTNLSSHLGAFPAWYREHENE